MLSREADHAPPQRTMRRRSVVVAVVLLVLVAAGWFVSRRASRTDTTVDVATARRVPSLRAVVTASGEITAVKSANVGSSVMGRLVELRVKEGERVRAGQVLAIIDPVQAASSASAAEAAAHALEADAQALSAQVRTDTANLTAARTRAGEAGRVLERARALHRDGLASQQDLDAAQTAADTATAAVAAAEAAIRRSEQAAAAADRRVAQGRADERRARDVLAKTRIEAPIAGIVTRLNVQEGEMVVMGVQNQPGTILLTISDLAAVQAEVKVAEADVLRLAVNDPATVTLEAAPGEMFPGRVVEIGASAIPQTGTQVAAREFKTVVRLDGGADRLRPGLTCDVEILVDERKNVVVVPLQAVVERTVPDGPRQSGVFVVRGETAAFVPLSRTGIIGGLEIEVDGVAEGTRSV